MTNPFKYVFRVRYAECDPQGVVFNGRYIEYVDVAFTEYIRAIFGGYEALLEQGLDMQVVNLNVAWKSSARADDVLVASVSTSKIGNTSISLRVSLVSHADNTPIANIDVVYVMLDSKTYSKVSVPDSVRGKLLSGAPDHVMNHAGVS